MERAHWWQPIVVILIFIVLIVLRFPDFFKHGNSRVIEPYGDGFKAYTTVFYHAKWDENLSHFDGMNYPYGEHVVPAATQPVISNTLFLLNKIGLDLTPYVFGIINFSLLISLLVGGLFLFLLFRKLEVPFLLALIASVGMTFLAPQFDRIAVHYGLAHLAVFPMFIYGLMWFSEKRDWWSSIFIGLVLCFFSGIHFYYFAILGMTLILFFLVTLFQVSGRERLSLLPHFGIQLIIPLLLYSSWIYLGDPVDDRCRAPYGFFVYRSYWSGLLTDVHQPLTGWIHQLLNTSMVNFEGESYLGIVSIFSFLALIIHSVLTGKWLINTGKQVRFLNAFLISSLLVLFFSLGWPFIWGGLDQLLAYFGPIQQFRSIGRFAWVFYYGIGIISWVYLSRFGGKWLPYAAAVILLFEAFNQATVKDYKLKEVPKLVQGNTFTDIPNINYERCQAIFTVPHYNIGSDNFWLNAEGFILQNSLALSMQTGLPVTSAMLTRTSLSQTINQVQLAAAPYRRPAILDDFPNNKPLIAVVDLDFYNNNKPQYQHIIEGGQLLYQQNRLALYEIPLDVFETAIDIERRRALRVMAQENLNIVSPFLSTYLLKDFVFESFNEEESPLVYATQGAWSFVPQPESSTKTFALPNTRPNSKKVLSFWVYLNQDLVPRTFITLSLVDQDSGEGISWESHQLFTKVETIDNNGWGLVEIPFEAAAKNPVLNISFENPDLKQEEIYVDEILIRSQETDLFQATSTTIWKNNRHYLR